MPKDPQTEDLEQRKSEKEKGALTAFTEGQAVAEARAREERQAIEERDRRQDERADKLVQAALDAERFTKRVLAFLLIVSIIANAVLSAIVFDRKLSVSKEKVQVGSEE